MALQLGGALAEAADVGLRRVGQGVVHRGSVGARPLLRL
jgi:hypothetical protein